MSVTSNDTIFGLGTTAQIVPPGATLALYFTQVAGQNSTLIKNGGGGTLYMIGMAQGATLSAAQLVTNASAHYLMGASEVLSIDGPASYYLLALSATTTVYQMVGKTAGF